MPLWELTPARRQMGLQTRTGRRHLTKPASRMADVKARRERQAGSFLPPFVLLLSLTGADFRRQQNGRVVPLPGMVL